MSLVWAFTGCVFKSKVRRPVKRAAIILFCCELILMPSG